MEGYKAFFDYVEELAKNEELKDYLVLGSKLQNAQKAKFFFLSRIKNLLSLRGKIDYRVIWDSSVKKDELQQLFSSIGKHKILPKKYGYECTIVVFNELVALIFNVDKPVVVKLTSREVSETYRNQFNLIWDLLGRDAGNVQNQDF